MATKQIKDLTETTALSDLDVFAVDLAANNLTRKVKFSNLREANPGSDVDVAIFTVNVTGTPTFIWDESEDQFAFNKGVDITGALDATGTATFTSNASNVVLSSATVLMKFIETDQAADGKNWRFTVTGGVFSLDIENDAAVGVATPIAVTRSTTTITEIELNATTLDLNGNADISGALALGDNLTITSTQPGITFIESDASTDNKRWLFRAEGELLTMQPVSDAGSGGAVFFQVTRSGTTTTEVELTATTLDFNGNADLSGTLLVSGAVTLTSTAGTPFIAATANDAALRWLHNAGTQRTTVQSVNAAQNAFTDMTIQALSISLTTTNGVSMGALTATGVNITGDLTVDSGAAGAGSVFGSATGGAKGAGTINAKAVYDDNVLLTDLVLDYAVDGKFDLEKYKDHPIASEIKAYWFDADAYNYLWRTTRHLPGLRSWDNETGRPSTGELITRLTASQEIQAVLIDSLNVRLKALESA